jgi:hypothetical protein
MAYWAANIGCNAFADIDDDDGVDDDEEDDGAVGDIVDDAFAPDVIDAEEDDDDGDADVEVPCIAGCCCNIRFCDGLRLYCSSNVSAFDCEFA